MEYRSLGNSCRIEIAFPKTLVFFYMFQASRELKEKHFRVQESKPQRGEMSIVRAIPPRTKPQRGEMCITIKHLKLSKV